MRKTAARVAFRAIRHLMAIILATACAAPPARGAAPPGNPPEVLTLEDAVRIAAENNRDLRKAMELRRQLEGKYVEERASALPQVLVSAGASRSWDGTQSALGRPPGSGVLDTQIGVSQPLFTWGEIGAAIRAARVGLGTADDQVRVFRNAAVRDVTGAFCDVLLAGELNAIARENRDQKGRLLDEARKRREAGTATDYDVLAAEVALKNAEPEVVRSGNLVRVGRERLRFLLGRGAGEVDVRGTLERPVEPPPAYDNALETALSRRPEIADLRKRIGVSRELVTIARAGDKPRVDLKGALGWRELSTGPLDTGGKMWSAGVFATWPLFDGLRTRGRVAQAKSDEATLRIEEAKLLDGVALEVRVARDAVQVAGEIVAGQAGTVAQAERLLGMAEKGFEHGVKTKLEVDDAQLNLVQARGSLAQARRDYIVARANLEHAAGTIGDGIGAPGEGRFVPAESSVGIAVEVLRGEPATAR